jgi:hypothetical protein
MYVIQAYAGVRKPETPEVAYRVIKLTSTGEFRAIEMLEQPVVLDGINMDHAATFTYGMDTYGLMILHGPYYKGQEYMGIGAFALTPFGEIILVEVINVN